MNEEATSRWDRNCGSETATAADVTTGAIATLTRVTTAALCATTHKEQCDAGDVCFARTSCTCTACTTPKPAITNTKNAAVNLRSMRRFNWCNGFIDDRLPVLYRI